MPEPGGARALVVDDQPVNRLVLTRMLEVLGLACDAAEDGGAALRLLDQHEYDYAFVDLLMPGLSGIETVRAWREREQGHRARVVAVTGVDDPEDHRRCLAAGFDDLLVKPVTLTTLRGALTTSAPPSAEPASHSSPLDADRLTELATQLGDVAVVAETVELFLSGLPTRHRLLAAAIGAGDAAALTDAAHTLKSSAATVGATQLAALCARLERIGRAGTTPDLTRAQLDTTISAARYALERWLGGVTDRV